MSDKLKKLQLEYQKLNADSVNSLVKLAALLSYELTIAQEKIERVKTFQKYIDGLEEDFIERSNFTHLLYRDSATVSLSELVNQWDEVSLEE